MQPEYISGARDSVFNEASTLVARGDFKQASAILHALVNNNPQDPASLYMLAICEMYMNHEGVASMLFKDAIDACYLEDEKGELVFNDEWFAKNIREGARIARIESVTQEVNPSSGTGSREKFLGCAWNNVAICMKNLHFIPQAVAAFETAVDQGAPSDEVYANWAGCYVNEGCPEKALVLTAKSLEIAPGNSLAHWHQGLANLELERWPEGWAGYDTHLRAERQLKRNYSFADVTPQWDGTPGQTVVVYGEQGLGDEIMFGAMLREMEAICKKVIFHPNPRLEAIFRRSFPNIDVYGGHEKDGALWQAKYKIDACIPMGSLGKWFRASNESFPKHGGYLKADPVKRQKIRKALDAIGPKPKIGLAWMGGVKGTQMLYRSIPLQAMQPLLHLDADFFSIQYTAGAGLECQSVSERTGKTVFHWQDMIDDLDTLFALIAELDLVITVPQTAYHQAGAMDKPCWVLTPHRIDWRIGPYQDRDWERWYPGAVKLFRQTKDGDWVSVIENVREALCSFLKNTGRSTGNYMDQEPITELGDINIVPSSKDLPRPTAA